MTNIEKFLDGLIQNLKTYGLLAMLILLPIAFTTGSDMRVFQEKTAIICFMSYASLYFGCAYLTLFFLLNVCLYLWNGASIGSNQLFNVFIYSMIFAISRAYFANKDLSIIYNAFKTLILINTTWMIFQVFGIDPIFIGKTSQNQVMWGTTFNTPFGLFHFNAACGMFFALCIPLLFTTGWLLPTLMLVPVALSKSAACYMTAALAFMYGAFYIRMVLFTKKIYYVLLVILITILGIFGVYSDYKNDKLTGGSRFENWHLYFKCAMRNPLFGHGPDSFNNLTPHKEYTFVSDEDYNPGILIRETDTQSRFVYHSADEGKRIERFSGKKPKSIAEWREAHNEFIQLFFEYGILGLVLLFGLVRETFQRLQLSIDNKEVRVLFGMLACYAIFSITQFPFHLARIAVFFPILLGAFYSKTDRDWDTFKKGEIYGQ